MPKLNISMVEETGEPHSTIACHVCRKRKIKCGRELPRCAMCEQSSQECAYPQRAARPGPKIGSSQLKRKRNHERNYSNSNRRQSQNYREDESSENAKAATAPSSPNPSETSGASYERAKTIQSLSFIIHPSHESCSPEDVQTRTPQVAQAPSKGETAVTAICSALSISPDLMNRL
jgi:Fungal Zn(2)-Cys(6) binuclear cluster domain